MADNKINVGGRLHSIATGNVLAGANEILDDSKNKKQNVINAEVDIALADRYTKEETYNKNELDSLITTPDVQYVTVTATEQTTNVMDVLPATGAANTIYRVGNWDGSKYTTTVYSEYAWNGSTYVPLNVKENGIDDEPTAGSDNLVKSGGIAEEFALGAVYDVSAKNPTAGSNNDGKWESLSALLSDANLNTLIPTSVRKGGMSIKFVQSSDNKYVQYRLMADEFTTDTTQWAIAGEGVYVENPEWVCVLLDRNSKILAGIKSDGSVEWAIGVPAPVKAYVDKQVNNILGTDDITEAIDSLKEVEKFLSDFKNSDTLKALLDTKANKTDVDNAIANINANIADKYKKSNPNDEEGNIVDTNTISSIRANPEYIQAITDSVGRLIEAIGIDGIRRFFAGINVQGTLQCTTDNPEYIAVWLDNQNRIVFGFKINGDPYFGYGVPSQIKEYISIISTDVQVKLDSITQDLANTKEDIDNKLNNIVNKETGKSLIDSNVADILTVKDIPEYLDAKVDNSGKLLSYRDNKGILHENVGIETKNISVEAINIKNDGMVELASSIKNINGYADAHDWSNAHSLEIPEPQCPIINITGTDYIPQTKGTNLKVWFEFWDKNGNYFKKKAILDAQGDTTRWMTKKNFAIDLCNDDWEGDDTFNLKIGKWVAQDSFHFKANYTDFFKAMTAINYKLYDKIESTRGILYDKPYKKYFIGKSSTTASNDEELSDNIEMEARTYPDGFPCIVYLNGDFYGIYAWQLKKHRDNMYMDRNTTDNIHLDGVFDADFWAGNISWAGFEVRNPKPKSKKWNLLCQDGSKYDGDNPKELMGTDSTNYDANDASCKKSAETKKFIVSLSKYMGEIDSYEKAYSDNKTDENLTALKTEIEKRFDINSLIDYVLFTNVIQNPDSVAKNWQWCTWGDSPKDSNYKMWSVRPYDLDNAFGIASATGSSISAPVTPIIGSSTKTPAKYVWDYYKEDMVKRYKELRDNSIISEKTIISLFKDWVYRVGVDNYNKEYKKWYDAPCNRSNGIASDDWAVGNAYIRYNSSSSNYSATNTYNTGHHVIYNYRLYIAKTTTVGNVPTDTNFWEDVTWVSGKTYNKGDKCWWGKGCFYEVTALKETTKQPFTIFEHYPFEMGFHDSIYRLDKWVVEKLELCDNAFNYNKQ